MCNETDPGEIFYSTPEDLFAQFCEGYPSVCFLLTEKHVGKVVDQTSSDHRKHMQDGNRKTSLKTLVEFEASSYVTLSLSPDGRWLAYGGDSGSIFFGKWRNRSPHLSKVQKGPEIANLRILEWSPDSQRLLAVSGSIASFLKPSNPTQISSFEDLRDIGIESSFWSYDSTFVILNDSCNTSTAIFGIDGVTNWLPGVRMKDTKPLLALRPDCKALALWASQLGVGESLMVYSCFDWALLVVVRPSSTLVSGVSWFPNSRALFVWDSIARNCVEFFYPDGSLKHIIKPADVTEDGVRTTSVSPCSSLIAIFNDNFKVLMYNTLIWRPVSYFDFRQYAEIPVGCHWTPFLCWSLCSQYLAISSSASSHIVVWSKCLGDYFNFNFGSQITDMTWHPRKPALAIATGSREVHLLKCWKTEIRTDCCKHGSDRSIPLRELRWVGASPTFLEVRSKSAYIALASVR